MSYGDNQAYTAGELGVATYEAEASYGTIPSTTRVWLGETKELAPLSNYNNEFHILPGARAHGAVTQSDIAAIGYRLRYLDRLGSEWHAFMGVYGLGYTKGGSLSEHLPDFTMAAKIDAATDSYQVYSGCKVNVARIIGVKPGAALEFEVEAMAQWWQEKNSRSLTGMQTVTLAADPAAKTTDLTRWKGNCQLNIAAGGAQNLYVKDFRLTVTHGLERVPGIKTGADSNPYAVAVGLNEGPKSILFEGNIVTDGQTFANSKADDDVLTTLTIPIDDETLTLSTGRWVRDDMPAYAQQINNETLKMRFQSYAIA